MSKQIDKKTKNSQSLKQFVVRLKELNNFKLQLKGNIEEVIADPKAWAEKASEDLLVQEASRIKDAKKLGEEFANEIQG